MAYPTPPKRRIPRGDEPELSSDAAHAITELVEALHARLYAEARRRARDEGLDLVSSRHVSEAFRAMLPNYQRPWFYWKAWAADVGVLITSISAQGIITELLKPDRADWNVAALVIEMIGTVAGAVLYTWAKAR